MAARTLEGLKIAYERSSNERTRKEIRLRARALATAQGVAAPEWAALRIVRGVQNRVQAGAPVATARKPHRNRHGETRLQAYARAHPKRASAKAVSVTLPEALSRVRARLPAFSVVRVHARGVEIRLPEAEPIKFPDVAAALAWASTRAA